MNNICSVCGKSTELMTYQTIKSLELVEPDPGELKYATLTADQRLEDACRDCGVAWKKKMEAQEETERNNA